MKYLNCLLITLSLLLLGCNKNDETPLEIGLPIAATYLPATMEFNINDIDDEQKHNIFHLVNNEHIVNSVSELPDDPIGFSETFHEINFREYTLLIKYVLHDYTIDTYNNRYFRNTKEDTYNWSVNIGTSSDTDVDTDEEMLTRFAILVHKLPADAQVRSWFGLTSIGWYPKEK